MITDLNGKAIAVLNLQGTTFSDNICLGVGCSLIYVQNGLLRMVSNVFKNNGQINQDANKVF